MNRMKILIVSPHADDALLGCGATVIKHIENGDEVHHCIVTVPYKPYWSSEFIENREKQIKDESNKIGYTSEIILEFKSAMLNCVPQITLNSKLHEVVKSIHPDVVYIPYTSDLHTDHMLVSIGCKVALRPIHYKGKILMYETPSETEWGEDKFKPNYYNVVSEAQLTKKIDILNSVYKEEMHDMHPHPRNSKYIGSLALLRGYEIGEKLAEAFVLVREIL